MAETRNTAGHILAQHHPLLVVLVVAIAMHGEIWIVETNDETSPGRPVPGVKVSGKELFREALHANLLGQTRLCQR